MNKRPFSTTRMSRRSGSLLPGIAIALVVCGGCLALVLNEYWLSAAQEELRTAAQSAALAGARELASDERLKPAFDSRQNADYARTVAENQANANQVLGPHRAQLDVHLARVEYDPETGRKIREENPEDPTSMLVVAHRDRTGGNPVSMLAPALAGRAVADVTVNVEASVTNLIRGVRPVGPADVPAWPVAVLELSADPRIPSWGIDIEQHQGSDQYRWDEQTRQVVPEADGLPEMKLAIGSTGNMVLIDVGTGLEPDGLLEQFRDGWSAENLAPLGGMFSLQEGPFPLEAQSQMDSEIGESFARQIGRARILALYSPLPVSEKSAGSQQTKSSQVQIVRLVAARLMAVQGTGTATQYIIQPSVVATRCALLDEDALYQPQAQGNPYIYRISLTQ